MSAIRSIEAFVVRIPFDGQGRNWGAGFWAEDAKRHPGLAADHPGDIYTEYPPLWRNRADYAPANETVIVRLERDDGIVGWGEAHTPLAGHITREVIHRLLSPLLIGQPATEIHPLWERMYSAMRLRGHHSGYLLEAISAIDIALWDAAGKAAGVPVAKLLGGIVRERIPVYASSLPRLHHDHFEAGLAQLVESAQALVQQGHRALKVKMGIDLLRDCETLRALRSALGDSTAIMVDVNGAYDPALARRAGDLMHAAAAIRWLEEPLPPELLDVYPAVTEYLDVAVAGGEGLTTRWAFKQVLDAGAFDIIQPDAGRAGGISECKRITELADVFGVPVAPHLSTGTAIQAAATLQWAAFIPNLMICEWPLGQAQAFDGVVSVPFVFQDGYVQVLAGPGLGIVIDEAALRRWEVKA